MSGPTYINFDLRVERATPGYRARVLHSPAGEASAQFIFPLSDAALDRLLYEAGLWQWDTSQQRGAGGAALMAARELGALLYGALFAQEVGICLHHSLDAALHQGRGLRLRLDLSATPELARVPWELLYSPASGSFLGRSRSTSIVRSLDLPAPDPAPRHAPLRALIVISGPYDYPLLAAEREWNDLNIALSSLVRTGLLTLDRLDRVTPATLRASLHQGDYQVVHIIGHSDFNAREGESLIVLEDEAGQGLPLSGRELAALLPLAPGLVVLNACNGARISRSDRFAAIGRHLLRQGVSAVVATQSALEDAAAAPFAKALYSELVDGQSIDTALAAARGAIAQGDNVGWSSPVLYCRATDETLWQLDSPLELVREIGASLPCRAPVYVPLF